MSAPQIDPAPRDLGAWKTGDSAAMSASGLRARDVEGVLTQVEAKRRIRNEALAGIALLICMLAVLYVVFFVVS